MNFFHDPETDFEEIGKLSKREAADQARALREAINYHDYLYYVKNSPEISDAVYDRLFARLEEDRVESFMRTIEKESGGKHCDYYLEPKFDGFSVEIVYDKGGFKYGATRGNGEVGEDISHILKTIGPIPLSLQHGDEAPDTLALRGEVFMPRRGSIKLNKQRVERGEEPFANPRNAAAGLSMRIETSVTGRRGGTPHAQAKTTTTQGQDLCLHRGLGALQL